MRISEEEFYDNKDVITQIEWLKSQIGKTLIKDITVLQEPDSGEITLVFLFEDGSERRVTFRIKELVDVKATQIDDVVTLEFQFTDGDTKTAAFRLEPTSSVYFQDLHGNPYDNTALKEALDAKLDDTDIEQIETEIREHDTKINEMHADLETVHSQINAHSSQIEDLNERVSENTGAIGAIKPEITEIKNNIATINSLKLSAFQSTPDNAHYPTEKLLFELVRNHVHDVPFTDPPGAIIKSVVEDGNGLVNSLIITFSRIGTVPDTVIGTADYKPTAMGGYFQPLSLPEGIIWASVNELGQISVATNFTQEHEGDVTIRTTYPINATGRYE